MTDPERRSVTVETHTDGCIGNCGTSYDNPPCPGVDRATPAEAFDREYRALMAELSESPLPGARYAYEVVGRRGPSIKLAMLAAIPRSEGEVSRLRAELERCTAENDWLTRPRHVSKAEADAYLKSDPDPTGQGSPGAPREDERLREALDEAIRLVTGAGNGTVTRSRPVEEWQRLYRLLSEARAALAAARSEAPGELDAETLHEAIFRAGIGMLRDAPPLAHAAENQQAWARWLTSVQVPVSREYRRLREARS